MADNYVIVLFEEIKTVLKDINCKLEELPQVTCKQTQSEMRNVVPAKEDMAHDIKRINAIIGKMECDNRDFTADDAARMFHEAGDVPSFFRFMEKTIARLKQLGKIRTSETYASTMNSFKRFLASRASDGNGNCGKTQNDADILFEDMDSDTILSYEAYLKKGGISRNSSSFYMRNLRAVYNRAVEKNLTTQRFPFKNVYTGVEKTTKRAVTLKAVRQIRDMDLSMNPALDFARDMFLFSFYTRGMSFVDMAYLRKKDLQNGLLSYRRRKTGQQILVKWENCMKGITDKYDTTSSVYLLPIIKSNNENEGRKQYINTEHNVNRSLKIIGKRLGLSIPLTMYVARHAWASIARSKNIPLSVISESTGHDSETTTRIYLASLDTAAVDKANRIILKSL